MKKYILLTVAAISLAACNSEDNYIDEPVAARISATIGESTLSRASDVKWEKGDSIGISMSGRYLNMKYTTGNGDGAFAGNAMYFQNKQNQETLVAYYPYTGTESQTPSVVEASTSAGLQTADGQPAFDFLYAVKENVTGAAPNVNLAFSHRMSKLTFIFKNGNDGTDVGKITSYEITGLVLDGTFDPVTGVCAAKAVATAPLGIDIPQGTVKNNALIPSLILFPQAVDKVTLKIKDSDGQDYTCDLKFTDNRLVSGNNYIYTITVKKTELAVNSTIAKWKNENLDSEAISDDSDDLDETDD